MPTASEARADPALRRLGWVLIAGLLPVWLDTTVVNVALDNLAGDLNASPASIQWVNTAYLLALAMMIPFTGWALARFGARSLWLACLVVFLAGSVLAGAAWDVTALIAFRVLQGVGGGLLMPVLQTLLVRVAGPERLGRAMATVGLPAVLVPIAGPVLGGLIVAHTSWRVVFFINVPLTLIALVLAWRGLPERSGDDRPAPLDALGLALVSPGLAALLYGLSQTGTPDGFTSPAVLVPLAVGTVLVAAFAVHALRTRAEPALDLRLFRVRSFAAAGLLLFLSGLSLFGVMMLLPLYYQQVRGFTVVQTGLLLVPQGIGSLAVRQAVGRLTDRLGPRPVVLAGVLFASAGMLVFAQAGPGTALVPLGIASAVFGAGLSAVTIAVMAGAYQGLTPAQVPHASSATRIVQQVGGAFGTAVLATALQWPAGFRGAFWWAFAFALAAVVPAALLPGATRERPA
ncbi:DHA2 family efflux MFS transporter permease subunit [Nonomuraea purpurea]|uniref:DHA2 family efflux MFS transporter permease subunit n=1 Tax=Nonomuraea purpurea TaxID=1849276 RepID=A0ABV8GDL1_9ACTN